MQPKQFKLVYNKILEQRKLWKLLDAELTSFVTVTGTRKSHRCEL